VPAQNDITSLTLLGRLRADDGEAWGRAVNLYYPLVRRWCTRAGLQEVDASDVAQEVFKALSRNVVKFRSESENGQNSFRGWLWGITHNQLLAYRRQQTRQPAGQGGSSVQARFNEVVVPVDDERSADDEEQDRVLLIRRAVTLLQDSVEPHTWQAFWRVVVEGHSPADVARDLGISAAHIYVIKGRLLRRLRSEFDGLLD